MIFFSLLAVLALEHYRPLRQPLPHFQYFADYAAMLHHKLDGGEHAHGVLAWSVAVLPFVLAVWLIQAWLGGIGFLLELAWSIAVLYFTMGLKYFSGIAEKISGSLRAGDLDAARHELQEWHGGNTATFGPHEVSSVTIEKLLSHSHRQTFGVLFWFILLGPAGAVLYRLSSILSMRWRESSSDFASPAIKIFHALNWVPQRVTALTYAVAGDFEDAMYCWRTQFNAWPDAEEGIVMAVGAGAMGVRLGVPVHVGGHLQERWEVGLGEEPDADQIDSASSMIWRGLIVWLVIGFLLMVAGWAS